MKHNFISKIKEIAVVDLFHILLFLVALPIAWIYKKKRKHFWLICENKEEARDNGYWLYRYIRKEHPEQDVVYAIDPLSKDFPKVHELGPTVSYGTLKHWIYYLAADINISSQKGGKPNAAVCYLLEVYGIRKNTRVFLQHGIIKDDLPFVHYENSKITMFVTSTKQEWEFVKENFNYKEGAVKLLGLCRFDNLHHGKTEPRQILAMPTWRSWISPPSHGKAEYEGLEAIRQSEYYKGWNNFLQNPKLYALLEKQDKILVFYQHREMQKFKDLFQSPGDRIIIAGDDSYDVQQLLMTSAFMITDYSSVAMDFAYMDKPLVYYQFDYEKFRQEQYAEGYFSYKENGFGPVCMDAEALITVLTNSVEGDYSEPQEYARRRKDFFTLRDENNCRRNYEAIKELQEKLQQYSRKEIQ